QRSEGRIETAKAPVAVLVVPLRLDPTPRPDAAGNGVAGVREDAGPDAGEEGSAERRSLLRLGRLERQAKHRREDPEPELAPRAAAGDAAALGPGAELAKQLEGVAQPVGHSLQHRPPERAAVVADGETDECATGVGVRVRRPFACEVRREQKT